MQLQLPTALEDFIRQQVASGRYRDESEVVSDALRLFEERCDRAWDEVLAAIDKGEADIAAGRSTVLKTEDELHAFFRAL
jgi:putative addiction module CopG family antidote